MKTRKFVKLGECVTKQGSVFVIIQCEEHGPHDTFDVAAVPVLLSNAGAEYRFAGAGLGMHTDLYRELTRLGVDLSDPRAVRGFSALTANTRQLAVKPMPATVEDK